MPGARAEAGGDRAPRKRRSFLRWLAMRVVVSFAVMGILSLAGVGYFVHRDRTLLDEAARGLDAIADKLEAGDKDAAAERLRGLGSKLERLGETSGEYSSRVKGALERIRGKSEDLYEEARRAIDGARPAGPSADGATGVAEPDDAAGD